MCSGRMVCVLKFHFFISHRVSLKSYVLILSGSCPTEYCCRKHGNNQDDDDDDDDDEIGVTESGSTAVTTFVSARGPSLPCHSPLRSVALL